MFKKALLYFRFLVSARSKYNIHSPFVHLFIQDILDDKQTYYSYMPIEHLRKLLLTEKTIIKLNDLGVGSKITKSKETTISKLTDKVQSSNNKAQLIFRMINYFRPKKILEIGTSLGLTTAYIANANRQSKITTVEGDQSIAKIAKSNFKKLKINNIKIINNEFDKVLPELFKENFNFVFFDGNHSKEATLRYFNWSLKHKDHNSIFVFDDIYWSKEMLSAWEIICNDKNVTLSIDLFSIGVIFFIKKNQKENFKLIHRSNFF